MFRQIVTPKNTQLILELPEEFVGHQVEVIAFTVDSAIEKPDFRKKKTIEEAIEFFKKNAVDFSKIEKWKREDLYD